MFTEDKSVLKVFKADPSDSTLDSGDFSYTNSDKTCVLLKSPPRFPLFKISAESTDSEFAV